MLVDILFLVQFTLLYLNTGESAIKASFLFENLKFIDHEIECLYKKIYTVYWTLTVYTRSIFNYLLIIKS